MKRRQFGLMAGSSLAMSAAARPVLAQATPDPNLLKTTLTPYGAERAGNADGSIPAWTGGWTTPPVSQTTPVDVPLPWGDEAVLYKVDSSNLAQYRDMVSDGIAEMITKFGFYLKVYPTHRTAAAPQYVYDNIAQNAVRAKLDPAGGRFGFTGGYGGIPFPIIDTSDPQIGGAQLVWNHLVSFQGYMNYTSFSPAIVVAGGTPTLVAAELTRFEFPYYDPNGSVDTYEGYFEKLHTYEKAPADVVGQEELIWHTSNVANKPDIVWTLLNGQGRVRKAPNEAYDTPSPLYNGISNIDESQCFYGSPQKFDWTCLGKKEMLVPYNNNNTHSHTGQELCLPKFPSPELIRWEKHRVWVLQATLHPGERNVLPKRLLFCDEDSSQAIMGQGYDAELNLTRVYFNPLHTLPSVPVTLPQYIVVFSLVTGDYVVNGNFQYAPYTSNTYYAPQPASAFDATQMAAGASF